MIRETSLAARPTPSRAATDRARILEYIRSRGIDGATDLELEAALHIGGSTVRPRRGELARDRAIVLSGEVRRTPSGHRAMVWVVAHA